MVCLLGLFFVSARIRSGNDGLPRKAMSASGLEVVPSERELASTLMGRNAQQKVGLGSGVRILPDNVCGLMTVVRRL
jgi:hypothetical protein